MNSKIFLDDLEDIAISEIPFEKFKDTTLLITGATGLIGSLIVKTMIYVSNKYDLNITVISVVRDEKKMKDIFDQYTNSRGFRFVVSDITDHIDVEEKIDYVIHCANVTSSKVMVEKPVETIETAVLGTNNILKLAVRKKVKKVIYISSMEMYGTMNDDCVDENKLGYVDISKIRSCYPESKRMCENLCNSYASEYGLDICSARLAQTFGPGILQSENRVFAQFARSVINKQDIVLHTKGLSEGNYCYTTDAIKALFYLLLYGQKGEAYNVCNEDCHTTILDMAKLVIDKCSNNEIKLIFDIPENINTYGYASDTKLKLSSKKLQQLGWTPKVNLLTSYERLLLYMTGK